MDSVSRIFVNDKEIILVPTAHVSQASVDLVKKVIEEEQPDSVAIELDDKRYENIKNPKAWEETDLVQVVKSKRVGFMLANLALSSYQKRLAEKLGTAVGGEMIQGMKSAEEVGADLVLADRDIQTTFLRIWRQLTLREKWKMIISLIIPEDDEEDLGEESIEELLQGDMIENMLSEMKDDFPNIVDILIHERDQYLSDKIKNAPGKKIVAVLGGAHVPGVEKELFEDVDIEAISTLPPKKHTGKIIGWSITIIILGLLAYGFVNGVQTGLEQIKTWLVWNGGLAALFTILALGHPLSVLTSLVVAPFSSLSPAFAVGWFSGLVQATVQKPTVKDLQHVQSDIFSIKGFYRNKVLKVFMVVIFANIGSSIGTFIAGADIISNLFG